MPAHNDSFPWMSYYGNYTFFEGCMRSHNKVANIQNIGEGLYEIDHADGRTLIVFICECYSFGMAEHFESVENLGDLNAVIINSNWCGYTMEAKLFCRDNGVGLFDIKGFMAALNIYDYWNYLTKEEKERTQK